MPLLTDYLKTIDTQNKQRIDSLKASIDSIAQSQSLQSQQLQQLTSGNLTFQLEALQQLQLLPPPLPALSTISSTYTSAQATPLARSPSPPIQVQEQERELLEPPKHRMCCTVRTVEALWRKWTVGLQGHLSIEVLDRK